MAFNLNDFARRAGTTVGPTTGNTAWTSGAKAPVAPKPGPLDFFKNAGTSLASIPLQVGKSVVDGVAKGIRDTAGGISEALTAGRQNSANLQYQQAIEDAGRRYHELYTSGKMSKAQYTKLSQGLIKQSEDLSHQIGTEVAGMTSPEDFASGLVSTAAIPFAAGRLAVSGAPGIAATAAKVLGGAGEAKTLQLASQTAKEAAISAAKIPVKYALIDKPVAETPIQINQDLSKGKTGKAALDAALLASPLVLAGTANLVKRFAPVLKDLAFGKSAVLTDTFGVDRVKQWDKVATPEQKLALKSIEMFTQRQRAGHDTGQAFAEYLVSKGVDPKKATLEQVTEHWLAFEKNTRALEKHAVDTAKVRDEVLASNKSARAEAKAINNEAELRAAARRPDLSNPLLNEKDKEVLSRVSSPVERVKPLLKKAPEVVPENAVVSADFRKAVPTVVAKLQSLGDVSKLTTSQKLKAVDDALAEIGNVNPTVKNQIAAALTELGSGSEMASRLKPIVQKMIVKTPKGLLDEGYIATLGPKERAAVPTLAEAGQAGKYEIGSNPAPVIGTLASAAEKVGVGFKDYSTAQIGKAKAAFAKEIDGLGNPALEGKSTYQALEKLADSKRLTDVRQLRQGEIEQALNISPADAKNVMKAAKNMFDDVKVSERGFAGKLQDANLKINPLASEYSRLQSQLRYSYNPAFRAQQKIEAFTLGQVASGGHAPLGDVTGTLQKMREAEFLPKSKVARFTQEEAGDHAGLTGITTHLSLSEEKSLARTLQATAAKNGRSVDDELKDEGTRRLLRAIVQNPKQGILSSNAAKAMNLLFFPSNYNTKVTGIALKALASQAPAVQFGVIKNVNDFHDWLKTDDGIKWQSKNSELIGLVNYFSPINSIEQTMKFLGSGDVRQLGVIGGLPFGVISRVFEGQTGIKSNPPYLDPKTGEIVPDKIPQSEKARLQQFARDVIDTVFTYPGRQAGLGSKTDLINTATGNILKPNPSEVKTVDRSAQLSPAELNRQRVLQAPTKAPASTTTFPAADVKRFSSYPAAKLPPLKGKAAKAPRPKTKAKRIGQPF